MKKLDLMELAFFFLVLIFATGAVAAYLFNLKEEAAETLSGIAFLVAALWVFKRAIS